MYIEKTTSLYGSAKPRVEERPYGEVVVFEGYLSRPEVDADNDLVEVQAWAGAKAEDTALLWQHRMDSPVGKWVDIQSKSDGLWGRGEINMGFELGKQAGSLVMQGALTGLSVGFAADKSKVYTKESTDAGGRKRKVRHIPSARLHEVSLVTRPCLASARISKSAALFSMLREVGLSQREIEAIVNKDDRQVEEEIRRSGEIPTVREFEGALRDAGYSRKQRAELGALFSGLMQKYDLVERDADKAGRDVARDADVDRDDAAIERDAEEAARADAEAKAKAERESQAEAEQKAAQEAEDFAKALQGLSGLFAGFTSDIKKSIHTGN